MDPEEHAESIFGFTFWVQACDHKLYPDQILAEETKQHHRVCMECDHCTCHMCVHAPKALVLFTGCSYIPFSDVLVVRVFQNELTYHGRRGFPILGRPLPALKPRYICQQWAGGTATPGDTL